jgi:predicted MFS family arabinose efflux permease
MPSTPPPPTRASSGEFRSFAAFRYRDFRILWTGTLVSNAGSWMQKVTTAWLIYQLTGSEVWLGVDAFASGIPTVLLLPLGGVLADRVSRRTLLIWTNLLSAIFATVLGGLQASHVLRVWHIVAVSVVSGIVQAGMVPASTSLLPALVDENDIQNAIALNSAQFNLSRVLGPALGGAVLVYFGAAWAFALNAASFLVLVAAFVLIKQVPHVKAAAESVGRSLKGGVAFVKTRVDVALLLSLVLLAAFFGAPVVSMLPALVRQGFARDASSYSFLLSAFGLGAVISALLTASFDRKNNNNKWNLAAIVAFGLTEAGIALTGNYWCVAILVAGSGFCFVGMMIRFGASILQLTPDSYRGRVSSFQQIAFRSGQPLGALLAGVIARHFGIRLTFLASGAALIVCATVVAIRLSWTTQFKEFRGTAE